MHDSRSIYLRPYFVLSFLAIFLTTPVSNPILYSADVEESSLEMRQQEIDAKMAKAEQFANKIQSLQQQYEQEKKDLAAAHEKIWRDFTEKIEAEHAQITAQLNLLEDQKNLEKEKIKESEVSEAIWKNYLDQFQIQRSKLDAQTVLLYEKQSMFEKELDKKKLEENALLRDKEGEIQRLQVELKWLRHDIEQSQKAFETYEKELKARSSLKKNLEGPASMTLSDGINFKNWRLESSQPEYYVEVGDILDIEVWRVPDLSRSVTVRPDGRISMPVIGDVRVVDCNLIELRELLTQKLSDYIWSPQVSISIRQFGGRKFIILGEIGQPGVYRFDYDLSLLEGIALAGGFREQSRRGKVMVIRGDIRKEPQVKVINANMENLIKRGVLTENIQIKPGDIIYVGKDIIGNYREVIDNVVNPFFNTAINYFIWHSAARTDHNS